jgi:hypothetical protein
MRVGAALSPPGVSGGLIELASPLLRHFSQRARFLHAPPCAVFRQM